MHLEKIAPGVEVYWARPKHAFARAHAYALDAGLVEPAHQTDEERAAWLAWIDERKPPAILLTHHHFDHVFGVDEIQKIAGLPVWGPPRPRGKEPGSEYTVDRELHEGDDIGYGWRVLSTPGHTNHHIAFFNDATRVLIAGDVLTIGDGRASELFATWKRLARLDPAVTLTAHHYPIDDHLLPEWVATRLGEADVLRGRKGVPA